MLGINAQENESQDFSKWQVRLRGLAVVPNESATIQTIGGDLQISNAYVPELDFTYFFTKNFAAELILATTKQWFINIEAKYVLLNTDVTINAT